MIKISSQKELHSLLKIFAEESVKKAKRTLNEDAAQENYINAVSNAESKYKVKLSEEEEGEPAENDGQETKAVQSEEEENNIESSLDNLVDVINRMRAGRSTKNKDIEDSLQKYHERLDDDERKILYIFLKQLANILQGAVSGEDAVDPSDPPLNADVVFGDEQHKKKQKPQVEDEEEEEEVASSGEDNSPPIVVDKPQNLSEIRKRVQRLMKRY